MKLYGALSVESRKQACSHVAQRMDILGIQFVTLASLAAAAGRPGLKNGDFSHDAGRAYRAQELQNRIPHDHITVPVACFGLPIQGFGYMT